MARLVSNSVKQIICAKITTNFSSGSSSVKVLKADDIVENLRYIVDEELKSVTGRISQITGTLRKVTSVSFKNPQDYFSKDVTLKHIVVDTSEQYHSDIVMVPAFEVVEDEGVTDVTSVYSEAFPLVTMDMEYTDGTIKNQVVEVGDILADMVILDGPGKPDITGTFRVSAWYYIANKAAPVIKGLYLTPVDGGNTIRIPFDKIVSFEEKAHSDVTNTKSLGQIADALNEADEVFARLDVDVKIPEREDGKITTLLIPAGKTLNMDMAGHNIETQAYAFYVNGGVLNISNTSPDGGKIKCTYATPATSSNAFPAIYVASDGVCNMDGGVIDTTNVDTSEGKKNWMYGVVCSGNGIFNMTGGHMIIGGASGIAITNGTATGEGAKFTIGGNARIDAIGNAAVYLADNKKVVIKDQAVVTGGVVLRMGDLDIEDNAILNSTSDPDLVAPLGEVVTQSGVDMPAAAILLLTGVYGSSLGNDLNVKIAKSAKVNGFIDNAIDICTINTKFDQKVTVDIENDLRIYRKNYLYRIYTHDELVVMAEECGRTLGAETHATDLTIKVAGETVYPIVDAPAEIPEETPVEGE